jgi:rubrerythrin
MDKTKAIDFRKITLRDALDLAVLVEEEAKDRYGELADQMYIHHNPEAETFFRFMQDVETKHETKLQDRRQKLFGDAPRTVRREMIFDIEAPEYDEARATMTVRQALEAALRSEEKAGAFFEQALDATKDPDARKLFEELRAEEKEHEALVRKQMDKLPPDDGTPADEDEPVAL